MCQIAFSFLFSLPVCFRSCTKVNEIIAYLKAGFLALSATQKKNPIFLPTIKTSGMHKYYEIDACGYAKSLNAYINFNEIYNKKKNSNFAMWYVFFVPQTKKKWNKKPERTSSENQQ